MILFLQTILNDLGKIRLLSSAAQLMKVQVHLLLTDLEAAVPSDHLKEGTLLVEYTKEKYLAAQEMLLTQVLTEIVDVPAFCTNKSLSL